MRISAAFALVALAGCATAIKSHISKINYSYTDDLNNRSFNLEYVNTENRKICISPDYWPNQAGKINQASSYVWVDIEQYRFNLLDYNTGYCPKCSIKVLPGQKITGHIPYAEFQIPEHFYKAKKILHFQPQSSSCD
jgi:hypothetical protein